MSSAITEMDNQIRKWVAELDDLYARKKVAEELIPTLEKNIEVLKQAKEILSEGK